MINKDKEVGGTHYSDMKIEPIELINALNLDFTQGSIVKYVSRYKNKNGIEDLKKALHYSKIGISKTNQIRSYHQFTGQNKLLVDMYCMINGLSNLENLIIGCAMSLDYVKCEKEINNLIERQERDK